MIEKYGKIQIIILSAYLSNHRAYHSGTRWLFRANGPIRKEQIAVIEDIMNNYYNLDKSDRDLAIKHFRTGKDSSTTYIKGYHIKYYIS